MAEHNVQALCDQAALVTGSARRLGAAMVRALHTAGANVAIHCHRSRAAAAELAAELDAVRPGSACVLTGDLRAPETCARVVDEAIAAWGRLDVVVNNASTFYPTAIGSVDAQAFDDLLGSNLRAPFFVVQAAAPALRERGGCVVNMTDIHGLRPRDGFPVYCAAKAGLVMLTQSLARELAPDIRVNAIAPGSILWPEGAADTGTAAREQVIASTPLARQGTVDDITGALLYLVAGTTFVTGEVLAVDGGRGL